MADIRICSINVTSLQQKDRQIEIGRYLNKNNFDFGLIQETHLKGKWVENIKGYVCYRNDERVGTIIFAKEKFKCDFVQLKLETISATIIKVSGKLLKSVCVASIYIPCATNYKNMASDLDKLLALATLNPLIMGGDLNSGSTNQKYNVSKWMGINSQLMNLISPSTPTFARSDNILDHFLATTDVITRSKCLTYDLGLEHKAIWTTMKLSFHAIRNVGRRCIKWRKANWDKFADCARLCLNTIVPVERNLSNLEIDELVKSLTNDIRRAISEAIPEGLVGRGKALELPNEVDHWYKERRRLCLTLRRARGKWLANTDRLEHLKRSINEATVKIRETIKTASNIVVEDKIAQINNNNNRFRVINQMRAGATVGSNFRRVRLKDTSGKEIVGEQEVADSLADFYAELYGEKIPNCDKKGEISLLISELKDVGRLTEFNTENHALRPKSKLEMFTNFSEVGKFIKSIGPKTSSGIDKIPNIVLKKLPISYISTLTCIYNHCINNSYFPLGWKEAVIIPIPKRVGVIEAKDCRPISLTSNVGKLFECVIMRRLDNELDAAAIPDFQFGFKNGHSTTDALTLLKWRLISDREKGLYTGICSMDIKKAFDSVWHDGLLYKLDKGRVKRPTTKLIQSFLVDRSAVIEVAGKKSKKIEIKRGVPQGSRLGPRLYNIYIGDMKVAEGEREFGYQFADDTMIGYSSGNPALATRNVEKQFNRVEAFLTNWGIEVNNDKTDYMIARPKAGRKRAPGKKKFGSTNLRAGSAIIEPKKTLKYLGVTFQENGKFEKHAKEMAKKGKKLIGASRFLLQNKSLTLKSKQLIYKMLIRPGASYASAIWHDQNWSHHLVVMERWAFRYALNMTWDRVRRKHYPNKIIYEAMDMEDIYTFMTRMRDNHENRMYNHVNPLIKELVGKNNQE